MAAQYETITLGVSDLDRIKLPKFQRGFVWNSSKKNEFVQTLHEGFPFGSLLVYPESEETGSKLLLLDGQQRLSTIKQYKEDPLMFWKPINSSVYLEYLGKVNDILSDSNNNEPHISEQQFDELLRGDVDLADWSDEVSDSRTKRKELRDTIKYLQIKIKEYVNLDDLGILAIKFTGSKERIADVFANLNKGGMPLSKYEIYSASWINTELALLPADESPQQDQILDLVKNYYISMELDAEFDLNDFSEDELTINRSITLSEFGTALGTFVQQKLSALIPYSTNTINEIGFGLLGIITGTDNRQLKQLIEHIGPIRTNLQQILEKTERICYNLQDLFSKMLKRIYAVKSSGFETGLSTTFKTLSYFAALWNLDPDSSEYRATLRNIRAYYVYDAWTKVWSSHGDQRLLEYYPNIQKRNYLTPICQNSFFDAFTQWYSDSTTGINFGKETKAIVTIHANLSYMATTVPYGEAFELEHIIAKKKINDSDDPSSRKINGGALGNCMYLPKQLNNKKKDKTLHDINADGRYNSLIESSLYFSPSEFDVIDDALGAHDFNKINMYINRRGKRVAEDLIMRLLND